MSLNIKYIKFNFEESLKNDFSYNEITAMWTHWVVKEILNLSLINYFIKDDFTISLQDQKEINSLILHLKKNQPIQYFFGYSYFKGLKINIDFNVLIPRPETEELVDLVLLESSISQPQNIIDIGTGSGCIAIALKKHIKCSILAVDVSTKALEKAQLNTQLHNLNIDFKVLDILKFNNSNNLPNFDIIVSNPPYVCKSEISLDSNIYYEPEDAIFVPDDNPLVFYKSIFLFAKKHLNKDGKLFLEINPNLISDLLILLSEYEYKNIKIHKDFYGKKRFIVVYS